MSKTKRIPMKVKVYCSKGHLIEEGVPGNESDRYYLPWLCPKCKKQIDEAEKQELERAEKAKKKSAKLVRAEAGYGPLTVECVAKHLQKMYNAKVNSPKDAWNLSSKMVKDAYKAEALFVIHMAHSFKDMDGDYTCPLWREYSDPCKWLDARVKEMTGEVIS